MSWMKRRGQPSPNPTNPSVPMYNPNQHSTAPQSYQPQQHQQWGQPAAPQYNNDWYPPPSKTPNKTPPISQYPNNVATPHYWPQQQPYNSNVTPMASTQNYPQHQQVPQSYQHYNNQYPANQPTPAQGYYQPQAQNAYQVPQQHQQINNVGVNHQIASASGQTGEDPWNWDSWDDNSNTNNGTNLVNQQPGQQNVVDSFSNDTSWNWSVEESGVVKTETPSSEQPLVEETVQQQQQSYSNPHSQHEIGTLSGLEHQLNLLPSITRVKNENLTPQWSIESQVSQDSSEDVLLTSESDNRSNVLSQSSTTSHSPTKLDHLHDFGGQNNQYHFETSNNLQLPEGVSEAQESAVENIERAIQEMSLNAQVENKEIVSPDSNLPSSSGSNSKKGTPPLSAPPLVQQLTGSSSTSSENPYKKKSTNPEITTPMFLQSSLSSSSTSVFRPPSTENQLGVNLETVPDNSERPDQIPSSESIPKTVRKTSIVHQQWAENCEIAPINDRNQYLETGQLSDAAENDYSRNEDVSTNQNIDNNDSLPPPGLRRLVLGQMEQPETSQPSDNVLDNAPPPGLSRQVIGSTAQSDYTFQTVAFDPADYQNNEEPPVGLHRMIPGESSSPETSTHNYQIQFQPNTFDDGDNYVSETELNQLGSNLGSQRSATIGADTPPVTNQPPQQPLDPISPREGAVGINNEDEKEENITNNPSEDGATSGLLPTDNNRREDIEGVAEETPSSNAVRDQTVGQNTNDETQSSSVANQGEKMRGRNYGPDSERDSGEQSKERHNRSSNSGRYDKDRGYYDERRDRPRERESPDRYKDRKYEKRRPKDRRFEEDTDDYYSDKDVAERRHHEDREEYERRYNSLRRDKDKSRRGDRREYEREDRRGDYYYNNPRYDEEYYNRSRPSSRSDSLHDSYRERSHRQPERGELDRSRHRTDKPRDPRRRGQDPYSANPYYHGYNYDPYSPYYQQYQYQYYENLRRTNPQAYAEMYRKYYQNQGGAAPHSGAYNTEDRASVHSGRSSANDELNKDRYTRQSYYTQQSIAHYYRDIPNASSTIYTNDDSRMDNTDSSMLDDSQNPQRLTPTKFTTAHVKASIASGNMIHILPHYPIDGQPAILEIINLQSLLVDNEEQKELLEFPGPLIKGVTHKKTVIDFCENKIKKANSNGIHDVESYILMWELLILLLRQNGMVVGTDIAELLMKNRSTEDFRRESISSSSSNQQLDVAQEISSETTRSSPGIHLKEEYITDKFREYLLYGSGKEALEWAMKNGLWGHALFLASKLDKRTYANVMMRFANGLTMNDPLQTLYQLLSGRQPAAVTCVADDKWGDWRPHLAMILSNTSQRPDLDRKAITSLGDTLQQRGSLYAAHFCYLMAQVEFGRYGSQNIKLALLSSSHQKPFKTFATNEAIFMTEIYEYACSLSDGNFSILEFQPYKYLMATRMVDHGLVEKALLYLEQVAISIKQDPIRAQPSLISRVCELSDRIKYCDPTQDESDLDNSRADSSWLSEIKKVLGDYNMGLISHQSTSNLTSIEGEHQEIRGSQLLESTLPNEWQQQSQQQEYYQQQQPQSIDQSQNWQHQQPLSVDQLDYNQQPIAEGQLKQTSYDNTVHNTQYAEPYWNQQTAQNIDQPVVPPVWGDNVDPNQQPHQQQIDDKSQINDYWNAGAQNEPIEKPKTPTPDESRPQISMPNQGKGKNYFESEDGGATVGKTASSAPSKPKPTIPAKPASTGWFGGIWSKLALRPKNQMKLPDDKNPTIVWDSEKKRWVNLEEDNNDVATDLKPPPKMSEMSAPPQLPNYGMPQQPPNYSNPPIQNNNSLSDISNNETDKKPPSGNNMFKLQRGRNLKKAYVDVFNPNGTKPVNKGAPASPEVFPGGAPGGVAAGNQMNFFVPQTIVDPNAPTDFLTPQNAAQEENAQISRWSSASSLSREVQFYMQQKPNQKKVGGPPMMYNPTQFQNVG